jgi:hypothetical protein
MDRRVKPGDDQGRGAGYVASSPKNGAIMVTA